MQRQALTREETETFGAELDALYQEVRADLGERDARHIRSHGARRARQRHHRPQLADVRLHAHQLDAGRGGALAREDPREHGDRAQRSARPVRLDERPDAELADLRVGQRLRRLAVAPLPQLRAPHLHQHPRQGSRRRLWLAAREPRPALAAEAPRAAGLERTSGGAVPVGCGTARSRSVPGRQGRQGRGDLPPQAAGVSAQGRPSGLQGLRAVSG